MRVISCELEMSDSYNGISLFRLSRFSCEPCGMDTAVPILWEHQARAKADSSYEGLPFGWLGQASTKAVWLQHLYS